MVIELSKKAAAPRVRIGSVAKAVKIIETIHKARRSMSIKELSDELQMPKPTLHHLMGTLVEVGFLSQDPVTRAYNIGLHLVEIGQSYLEQLDLRKIARPFLERLSTEVQETVHLLILDQSEVVYIEKVEDLDQEGTLRCSSFIGRRVSAYSTAAGKILLAFLPEEDLRSYLKGRKLRPKTEHTITSSALLLDELRKIREVRYAIDRQENEVGLQCVAAPVFDRSGRCIAALSVSGPVNRVSFERIESALKPAAELTAREISSALGYSGPV